MLLSSLKVVFCGEEDADLKSTTSTAKAILAIVGQPVDACGWYGGMRELLWTNIPYDSAVVFARKIAEAVSTPCSVEVTTSDAEKWANSPLSDASALLTYKAVREAVKSGARAFAGRFPSSSEMDFSDIEDYEPGRDTPPGANFPS